MVTCQQTVQLRKNEEISKNIQAAKNEPRRNQQFERLIANSEPEFVV